MNKLDIFLHLYLFQIEDMLNTTITELKDVVFHSEEANTDEHLKIFIKKFLLKHNHIEKDYCFNVEIKKDNAIFAADRTELVNIIIADVLLPNELTEENKIEVRKQKTSIYTNPDLYVKIDTGDTFKFISIELKSTKIDKIPGSSIQQKSPYEWVIFVQHKNNIRKVVTGMYINSITERLPFPDRSPRPEVGFKTLGEWNKKYRTVRKETLVFDYPSTTLKKELVLTNWHDALVKEWMSTIKSTKVKTNEKWFNHTIRLFSLDLITYYETLNEEDRRSLRDALRDKTTK